MSEQFGTIPAALANAAKLLPAHPAQAEKQVREILKAVPANGPALLLLGSALRAQGKIIAALEVLEPLAAMNPKFIPAQFEYGLALGDGGDSRKAIAVLSRVVAHDPKHASAWRALGDQKILAGDDRGADEAYNHHILASVNDPRLMEAAAALYQNNLPVAERLLRIFLKDNPTDVTAIRMLAETGSRIGRYDDAEKLLVRCLELAPGFSAARHNYAQLLNHLNKPAASLAQADILLKQDSHNPNYRVLKAALLGRVGEYEQAEALYKSLLKEFPNQPKSWMSYGHTLKTLGKRDAGVTAYRKAIALLPSLGEAYWSLANLKTFRFTPDEIDAMCTQLERTDLLADDRFHLDFALGKALEDEGDFAQSFECYRKANALRRESLPYNAGHVHSFVERLAAVFTREFFAARSGAGTQASDPIFIVGLPRSGSTLIEQILSSHSAVEGTMELHDIANIARELGLWTKHGDALTYPEVLQTMSLERFKAVGEDYLPRASVHRRLGRQFFIDKMPNNFLHAGFIHLILPNAKIIDARRHPLGCGFSCFKQHFARGQSFAYGLEDIGCYYADYVRLMAHIDLALPGRVHRVFYENMVAEPEAEVRRLLEYCGLPFEEETLRFYENDRAVRTASSEQVRQPIFTEGVEQWQNFEPWLGPLKEALGPVLTAYPDVPTF